MATESTEVAVVGAGVCGLLVAAELSRGGREVTVIERGGWRPHEAQVASGSYAEPIGTAQPNHEAHPDSRPYPWTYVYGVGGSTLAWAGVSPRFLPSDFALRTNYGVGRDWPLSYEDLLPYYERAEQELAVAGDPGSQPPHPLAPVDELVAPHLEPYGPLSQARPTAEVDGRPPCTSVARCDLCPTDARYSGLHTLSAALAQPEPLRLRDRTAVARLRSRGSRVQALECLGDDGSAISLTADTVILAAGGLENPALLLRSGLEGPDVGRWLADHEHRIFELELDVPARHGYGATPATGISSAWADGDSRSERGAVIALPVNPGIYVTVELVDGLVRGERGPALRSRVRERYDKTLVLDLTGEDLPREDRYLELSAAKDRLGLPLNRVHYPPDSDYAERGFEAAGRDIERRLAPLGARLTRSFNRAGGAHLLGTCFMGESDGVVDPNLRHHRVDNLYVAGGSAFPTYSPWHPTLTIAALALRLGDHLLAQSNG